MYGRNLWTVWPFRLKSFNFNHYHQNKKCAKGYLTTIQTINMKQKFFMLAFSLLAVVFARANDFHSPGPGDRKKDDLNGTVIHWENKKPLEGVTVTAVLVSKKEKVVITDDDGGYAFDELKPGTYKFVFEKAGFKKITKDKIVIKTDEAFQLNIEMIEADDYEIMPSPFHIGGM